MSYDLKAFCDELEAKLRWVLKETVRLQRENERLQQENQALREEVTLARLMREADVAETRSQPGPTPSPTSQRFQLASGLPSRVRAFYEVLPPVFSFDEFFQQAEREGVEADTAKEMMLLLLRKQMLVQRGAHIEKIDPFAEVAFGSMIWSQ